VDVESSPSAIVTGNLYHPHTLLSQFSNAIPATFPIPDGIPQEICFGHDVHLHILRKTRALKAAAMANPEDFHLVNFFAGWVDERLRLEYCQDNSSQQSRG
jgi:hypothetical protein